MLNLILILVLMWLVLMVLLAAWTLWFQGYIYSEPVGEIYWRAPAAGTALTAFLCLWVALDYRGDGRYHALHDFSAKEYHTYKYLSIINNDNKEEHYERRGNRYLKKNGQELRTRPIKIIASDSVDGEKHVFEPEYDAKHNFKIEKDQLLRYYEKDNPKRYMDERPIGQISIFHFSWLVMNLVLNFGFLIVWFLSLWLLLRFQWSHALGLAVVFWLVMLLFVVPPILTKAEDVAKSRAASQTTQKMQDLTLESPVPRQWFCPLRISHRCTQINPDETALVPGSSYPCSSVFICG